MGTTSLLKACLKARELREKEKRKRKRQIEKNLISNDATAAAAVNSDDESSSKPSCIHDFTETQIKISLHQDQEHLPRSKAPNQVLATVVKEDETEDHRTCRTHTIGATSFYGSNWKKKQLLGKHVPGNIYQFFKALGVLSESHGDGLGSSRSTLSSSCWYDPFRTFYKQSHMFEFVDGDCE